MKKPIHKLAPLDLIRDIVLEHGDRFCAAARSFNELKLVSPPQGERYKIPLALGHHGANIIRHRLPDFDKHGIEYEPVILVTTPPFGYKFSYTIYLRSEADLTVARLLL